MVARDDAEMSADPAVLQAEIARLRLELEGRAQASEPERDVDSVTDRLALQQEVDTLRQSLREKDRVVDVTAAQCRRLEDELEDQHLACDGLKQDLERKKQSLAAARDQTARLSRERQEAEDRYQALIDASRPAPKTEQLPQGVRLERLRTALPVGPSKIFVAGLTSGALIAVVLAFLAGVDLPRLGESGRSDAGEVPPQQTVAGASAVPAGAAGAVGVLEEDSDVVDNLPKADGTVRDRLRDGTFGPLMAIVAPARFTMGKVRAMPNDDQAPAHPVELEGFLIGVTEVTFEEYDRFARATGGRLPGDSGWGRGRRPVVDVTWTDAQAYARWLSAQTGRHYRLPSEAEWEYAAAAGRRTTFWWGYQLEQDRAVCFDCGTIWDNKSTAPAGTFDPNPFGLYDTAGNVMEWVADCYRPNYRGAPADGIAWTSDRCSYRVARGGSFNKPARSMARTVRHRFDPATRLNMLGFRLARDE